MRLLTVLLLGCLLISGCSEPTAQQQIEQLDAKILAIESKMSSITSEIRTYRLNSGPKSPEEMEAFAAEKRAQLNLLASEGKKYESQRALLALQALSGAAGKVEK